MNESLASQNGNTQATEPRQTAADPGGPSSAQRRALVHRFQAAALEEPDLLRANLGVLNGDLLLLGQSLSQWLATKMEPTKKSLPRSCRRGIELVVKLARQNERFGQIDMQARRARTAETP